MPLLKKLKEKGDRIMPIENSEHFHKTEIFKTKVNISFERYKRQNEQIEKNIKSKDPTQLVRCIKDLEEYSKENSTIKNLNHELKKVYNYLMKELQNDHTLLGNYDEDTSHNLKEVILRQWGEGSPYYEDVPRARALSAYENIRSLLFPSTDSSRIDEIHNLTTMKEQDPHLQNIVNKIELNFQNKQAQKIEPTITEQVQVQEKELPTTEQAMNTKETETVEIYKNLFSKGKASLAKINENLGKISWNNDQERHTVLLEFEQVKQSCLKSVKNIEEALQYEDPDIATYLYKLKKSIKKMKRFQNKIEELFTEKTDHSNESRPEAPSFSDDHHSQTTLPQIIEKIRVEDISEVFGKLSCFSVSFD